MELFDVAIIGGGINGTGIAAQSAHRHLKVALFEQNDLSSGTSSASTKLIHGGLRYLEHFELKLVKQSLQEQAWLLENAGHLIEPLAFFMPLSKDTRPAWMIRLGLFCYDYLSQRKLPVSQYISESEMPSWMPSGSSGAFKFYDAKTDDARLVLAEALGAKQAGAQIFVRHKILSVESCPIGWVIKAQGPHGIIQILSKTLVNATGPWVEETYHKLKLPSPKSKIKLVQGTHLVLPRLYNGQEACILQHPDKRVIFTIPYQNHFTLVGTTEQLLQRMGDKSNPSQDEINYLLNFINHTFQRDFEHSDIAFAFSGVRTLVDSDRALSVLSRDYKIECAYSQEHQSPVLHILGGKITTWRALAQEATTQLAKFLPHIGIDSPRMIVGAKKGQSAQHLSVDLKKHYPLLPEELLHRLAKNYGIRAYELLGEKHSLPELGAHYGHQLYQNEIEFLIRQEWASSSQDILWRRTKLGMMFSKEQTATLAGVFGEKLSHTDRAHQ